MASIEKFRSVLNEYKTAKPNQFQVQFDFKNLFSVKGLTHLAYFSSENSPISFYAESIQMPSHNISTSTNIIDYAHFEMPYGVVFEPVTINFYMDEAYKLRELFHLWASSIYKIDGSKGIAFYEDYTVDIALKSIDQNWMYNEELNGHYYYTVLMNAYPKMVGQIQYSQSSMNEVVMMPVTFAYEYKTEARNSVETIVKNKEVKRAPVAPPKSKFAQPPSNKSGGTGNQVALTEIGSNFSPTEIDGGSSGSINTRLVKDNTWQLSYNGEVLYTIENLSAYTTLKNFPKYIEYFDKFKAEGNDYSEAKIYAIEEIIADITFRGLYSVPGVTVIASKR